MASRRREVGRPCDNSALARVEEPAVTSTNHHDHEHHDPVQDRKASHEHAAAGEDSGHDALIDPVCGMRVRADTPHRFTYENREYLFCCAGCRERFVAAPSRYLNKSVGEPVSWYKERPAPGRVHPRGRPVPVKISASGDARPAAPAGPTAVSTIYTCPMHPE